MKAELICHPDYENLTPLNVFHKELAEQEPAEHPEALKNKHILYRKQFTLNKTEGAVIKITADDYYKLYINGNFVAMGPAASYPNCYNYNEIDVSKHLRIGENTIAVHTYYQGLVNRVWVSGDLRQMLYCELSVMGDVSLVSDESWKCTYHTAYTALGTVGYDTAYMECYDSRSHHVGFEQEDYDDSEWCYAKIRNSSDYTFIKQATPLLDVYDVKPNIIEKTDYGYFIDLGQEMVGYLSVKAKGNKDSEISLYYAEELTDDCRVRYEMRCNCIYKEKWILSGAQDILNNYDYKAFRYAEVHIPDECIISDISMTVRHYPYEEKTKYSTNNTDLEKILELCRNTVKYGTQENYVDCPTREKGQYLGDVSIAARAHAILTGDTALMKKAIKDFCASSFICPGIMAVSVSSLMQEIADYSLQLAASVMWVYKCDNDIEFLKYTEPYLTGMYKYFLRFTNGQGLIENQTEKWNMVDWPTNLRDDYDFPLTRPIGDGVHNVINAFWYGFLKSMNEIYTVLDMPIIPDTDKVKDAFFAEFYSEDKGLFTDSSATEHGAVHSNILPLLFGMCDKNDTLIANITDLICQKGLKSMGTYMSYFALAALVKYGKLNDAIKLATDKGAWLLMISEGATTTFEAWGKEQKWNTSLFHPWSVAPLIVFNDKYEIY